MVHQGEAVIKVDYDLLKDKGLDLITPIVITNSNEFLLNQKAHGHAESGKTDLFVAQKKQRIKMRIVVEKDYESMSKAVADHIIEMIKKKPNALI